MLTLLRPRFCYIFVFLFSPMYVKASIDEGNQAIRSFKTAKKLLMKKVEDASSTTLYCNASFHQDKSIELPQGFKATRHKKRSYRVEFEHVVPAENFGRNFIEWREGHPSCGINSKNGKPVKGRKCAQKVNATYKLMQADMYNLYPAIGSVNATRQNYNFAELGAGVPSHFGSCNFKVFKRKVEPPEAAKGRIARSYLYMDKVYSKFTMSRSQRKLMRSWDQKYPVTAQECRRYKKIRKHQKNDNPIMKKRCQSIQE